MHESSSETDGILAFLRQRDDEMAALLEELVSIPTENPPGKNYAACVDLVENHVRRAGLTCERFSYVDANDPADRAESLVCTYGNGKRALYFHGHYDVVPAQSGRSISPTAQRALRVWPRLVRHERRDRGHAVCDRRAERNRRQSWMAELS